MSMEIKQGNLLDATEDVICHQCNCVTTGAAHLAAAVFQRFPYSDIYSDRLYSDSTKDEPGHVIIRGNGKDQRFVAALLAQYYPGFSKYSDSKLDGHAARQQYFRSCLEKLVATNFQTFAFPWMIGCGAAGGDWNAYYKILEEFSETKQFTLYRLDQ